MDTEKQWVVGGELIEPGWLMAAVAIQVEHYYARHRAICDVDGRVALSAGAYINGLLARGIRQTWIQHAISPRNIRFAAQWPDPVFDELIDELRAVHIVKLGGGREIERDTYCNVLMINGFGCEYERLCADEKRLGIATL